MWISLLLSILSFSALSAEFCRDDLGLPTIDPSLTELHEELSRHAVSDEDVESAACKTKAAPSFEEITAFITKTNSKKIKKSKINDVQLQDTPELIEAFRRITTPSDVIIKDGQRVDPESVQKLFNINPDCSNVICAVKKIWGAEVGLKLLYLNMKHGYLGSELTYRQAQQFKVDEIDDVLMALEDLPPEYKPLADGYRPLIYRPVVAMSGKDQVSAISSIELYVGWQNATRTSRQYIVYHELSHNVATRLNGKDLKKPWLNLSQWKENDDGSWSYKEPSCFASTYGASDPHEDWAESMSMYRYNPKEFKKRCPEKYEYLKSIHSKEYLGPETCSL